MPTRQLELSVSRGSLDPARSTDGFTTECSILREMPGERAVRIPEHVLVRAIDDELVLLNLDNENYYGLDKVGATIWEAVAASPTVEVAVTTLLDQFDVDAETLSRDVEHLLVELSARGLVELNPS
jgi:hypothetical protein